MPMWSPNGLSQKSTLTWRCVCRETREMVDMGGQGPTQSGTLCFVRDEWAIANPPEDSVGGELKISSPINGIPKVLRTISNG
ncbi:MAG: hypothetical protein GDA56_16645 [Hormoscilla sp. GM7CHS1pb]|nr:hypothetical protein [Hormoscilla sp. GM7CHS1pb]